MTHLTILFCLFLSGYTVVGDVSAQNKRQLRLENDFADTRTLIESQRYQFEVQTLNVMVPSLGTFQSVEPGKFYINVTPKSLYVNLPTFGEYTDNFFNTDVPISFECKTYGYLKYVDSSGNWQIAITATDPKGNPYSFYLTVSGRGGAILKAVSAVNISISFDGIILNIDHLSDQSNKK